MEHNRNDQTGFRFNHVKRKDLLYEGTVSMPSPREYPSLLQRFLVPVLPDLTVHTCQEVDQEPLVKKRSGRYRVLFDQNMHFRNLLQSSTHKLQEDMRQNMRRYQTEKQRLQEQLSMLHNELLENQLTTPRRTQHSRTKDYKDRSQQSVTHGANNIGFETKKPIEHSKGTGVNTMEEQNRVYSGVTQSPNYFKSEQLIQARYSKSKRKGSQIKADIKKTYPHNNNQEAVCESKSSKSQEKGLFFGQRRQSSFNQSKYLPPLDNKGALKKLEWRSGRNLDPRLPNTETGHISVSEAIMAYKDQGRRILVSRESSFRSSSQNTWSRQSDISHISDSDVQQQNTVLTKTAMIFNQQKFTKNGLEKDSKVFNIEENKHEREKYDLHVCYKNNNFEQFRCTNLQDVSKSDKKNLKQYLGDELENKMKAIRIDSKNENLDRRSVSDKEGQDSVHESVDIFNDESISITDIIDRHKSTSLLTVPQDKIVEELKNNRTKIETPLAKKNTIRAMLPDIRNFLGVPPKNVAKLSVSKFRKSDSGNSCSKKRLPKLVEKGSKIGNPESAPVESGNMKIILPNLFGSQSSKNKFTVPQITLRPASRTGELERMESLLDFNTGNAVSLSLISKKREDPAMKWKALYMKIMDPKKRSEMLTDIVFAVREKMRENEHQLKYGVNPKSLITHNTLCDFLLFKPHNNNNNKKKIKKIKKVLPLPTHTAERSVRRTTASQLQDYLRRSAKCRPMIEHLQAEEYRLIHYGEKSYFNDK